MPKEGPSAALIYIGHVDFGRIYSIPTAIIVNSFFGLKRTVSHKFAVSYVESPFQKGFFGIEGLGLVLLPRIYPLVSFKPVKSRPQSKELGCYVTCRIYVSIALVFAVWTPEKVSTCIPNRITVIPTVLPGESLPVRVLPLYREPPTRLEAP